MSDHEEQDMELEAKGEKAEGGIEGEELSGMELAILKDMLKALGTKPKLESTADLRKYIAQYLKETSSKEDTKPSLVHTVTTSKEDIKPPLVHTVVSTIPGTTLVHHPTTTTSMNTTTSTVPVITPTMSTHIQTPRLENFSGDITGSKNESTFDVWKFQVERLVKSGYSEAAIRNAIDRSLKGTAMRIVIRLGTDATVKQILDKLQKIFGPVDKEEKIMAEFYSARQQQGEDVVSWGCRLEEILNRALDTGKVATSEVNGKLAAMFYEGLRPELQDICGHLQRSITDFDELRVAVREVEYSRNRRTSETTKKATSKAAVATEQESNTELKEIRGMINKLTTEMTTLKTQMQQNNKGQRNNGGYNQQRNNNGNTQYDNNNGYSTQRINRGNSNNNNRYRGGQRYRQGHQQDNMEATEEQDFDYGGWDDNVPLCYRCGQPGHLQIGCVVRLDHRRRGRGNLNIRRSTRRGRM